VPSIEIRPFERSDREQLTALVNGHIAAVIPGITVSVNAVMSQLEREPAEGIVDPWVVERRTLVAVERDAIVAGALLHRFASDERVSDDYRDAGDIRWLVFSPTATAAADALIEECIAVMNQWEVRRQWGGVELPALAAYGVSESWPHIRDLYLRHGFVHRGHVEIIYVAAVDDLPTVSDPPLAGLALRRSVAFGVGVRLSACLVDEVIGYVDVELRADGDPRARQFGWSDIGNLWVKEELRRRGIGTWLLANAADWLRLGGINRVVTYARPEKTDEIGFALANGFRELVRTERSWIRQRPDSK
jgi:GNAT superfamily N-acetyltransferase